MRHVAASKSDLLLTSCINSQESKAVLFTKCSFIAAILDLGSWTQIVEKRKILSHAGCPNVEKVQVAAKDK